jgi:hypothetical protein
LDPFAHACKFGILSAGADQELSTVSQAAEALSACGQTIRNRIGSGRLRGVRIWESIPGLAG